MSTKRTVPLLFEDLKIHDRLVRSQESTAIDKHLSLLPNIRLRYYENGFSISFAALDYCEHERVHCYYMMEGFDKYWIDAHNNREAYYANLPSGTYTFRVYVTETADISSDVLSLQDNKFMTRLYELIDFYLTYKNYNLKK